MSRVALTELARLTDDMEGCSREFSEPAIIRLISLMGALKEIEGELDGEGMSQNRQDQEFEMEALQSIYGDEFQKIEAEGEEGMNAFSVAIHVEIPEPISIVAFLGSENGQSELSMSKSAQEKEQSPKTTAEALTSSNKSTLHSTTVNEGAGESDDAAEAGMRGRGILPCATQTRDLSPTEENSSPSEMEDGGPKGEGGSASQAVQVLASERSQSFQVHSLPPLRLLCRLPCSYPSRSPPYFVLSAMWLDHGQLARLCAGLDSLWKQQIGQVVIFSWADWLTRECLPELGLTKELLLRPSGNFCGNSFNRDNLTILDPRAEAEGISLEEDMVRLLRWNEERRNQAFLETVHLCVICYSELPGVAFARLPCQHFFCWECMRTFAAGHLKDGTLGKLTCPDTECKSPLPPGLLRELLPEDSYARWEDLTLKRSLDSMADLVYCPRCHLAVLEEPDNTAQCAGCFFSFCSLCSESRHPTQPCMTPEARLRVLQKRRQGQDAANDQRRKETILMNEIMNLQYVKKESQQCPTCGMAISKTEGCNKMKCSNCSQLFCYKCGAPVQDYSHFGSRSCGLFDQTDIDAWEAMNRRPEMDVRGQMAGEIVARWPARRRSCPACRQINVKEGNNNHINCWACRCHFCALCSKIVRSSAEHYGPSKCRQHTADL